MDTLPDLRPILLSGLTWTEAKGGLERVDCALRRPHWCSPVVILRDGKLTIDDDGEFRPFTFAPRMGDRWARDWMMVRRCDDDGNKVEPTWRDGGSNVTRD